MGLFGSKTDYQTLSEDMYEAKQAEKVRLATVKLEALRKVDEILTEEERTLLGLK